MGIGNDASGFRKVRLDRVALGHLSTTSTKELADRGEDLFVALERSGEGERHRLASKIIGGGAQAAGDDDHVGPLARRHQHGLIGLHVVADRRVE